MSLIDRLRQGSVAATLRGIEEGTAAATRSRTAVMTDGTAIVAEARPEAGLFQGETPIADLLKEADQQAVLGVSMMELRALAGIPDPFGPCQLKVEEIDFSDFEGFRRVRDTSKSWKNDPAARQHLIERVEEEGLPELPTTARAFGRNQ